MQNRIETSGQTVAELQRAVEELPRDKARRVARLVLECRATLVDALEAVQLADDPGFLHEAQQLVPERPMRDRLQRRWWWARAS
jgi:hypothetical protein